MSSNWGLKGGVGRQSSSGAEPGLVDKCQADGDKIIRLTSKNSRHNVNLHDRACNDVFPSETPAACQAPGTKTLLFQRPAAGRIRSRLVDGSRDRSSGCHSWWCAAQGCNLRVNFCPSVSGVIPYACWQYVVVAMPLLTNNGCRPLCDRYDSRPRRMPMVIATGRTRKPTLTSDRYPMIKKE